MHNSGKRILVSLLLMFFALSSLFAQTKLLRFPDIHGSHVVFCYAGDIWKASADGGTAVRLTAHAGQELFPRFSPDGKWIAFTGQYDGDEQVYIIPSEGGIPKQLTYYPARGPLAPRWGYDNQVYGWSPDGKKVLFRSLRDANGGKVETALYTVGTEGGLPEKLPMPSSGAGDFAPDGNKIVYSPLFRDFRTWKRYEGGWAQDLYIFDIKTFDAKKIADSKRTERDPMWIGNAIYFVSDRDGTLNLYAYDVKSDGVLQVTRSTTWDVRWPSSDNQGKIVYELNGELQVFNVTTKEDKKISITVPDDGLAKRPSRYSAAKNIEDFELSPKGERVLFVARGDIFTAPIEKGPTRNLTNTSNAHDKWARWSPDGSKIAFISDMSGEEQIYLIDQKGEGKPVQLTTQFKSMLSPMEWSPDGKRMAVNDKDGKLYVLTVTNKNVKEIADHEFGEIYYYSWSPDGGHLAFSMRDWNGYWWIYIWSVSDSKVRRITGTYYNEYAPAWEPDGNYLYYLSDRQFAPLISTWEWNFAGNRETGIYAMALRKDVKHPFPPESDEVTIGEEKEKEKDKEDKKDEKKKKAVKIDFDGLADRTARVPIEDDNMRGLSVVEGHILFVKAGAGFYGRESYTKPSLQIYSIKDRELSALVDDIENYALSFDGKKVLIKQKNAYHLYDVKPKANEKKTVPTNGLMVDRVPAEEWAAIFEETWRRFRDFFYVKNMHGYDWKAIGDRYRPLLKYVAHRSDLNYVLGEMVAELSVGHAYIVGGDFEIPTRPKVALPGARHVTFNPIDSEARLLYMEWVEGNRKRVDEMTEGRVGYIHLPDMGSNGIYEFIKWYYPQIRKEGLVADVRSNGGGNVSQWIIERLDSRLLGTRFGYRSDKASTYPASVFHGHKVCLINETSASDGDIFPYYFREANLGPLIGKRTWGGVVGISGKGPFIDGGSAYVPLSGTNDTQGNWIIEGYGVDPDIVVENDPKSVLQGRDPQLERGIEEVLKKMNESPMKLPSRAPDPIKTK